MEIYELYTGTDEFERPLMLGRLDGKLYIFNIILVSTKTNHFYPIYVN